VRGGLVITRREPLRVEVRAEGDDFRLKAATAVADQLADWGYEVDPAAGRTLRLTFDRPTVREEIGDPQADPIDVLTRSEKAKVAVAVVEAHFELIEPPGRVAWTSRPFGNFALIGPLRDRAAVKAKFPDKAAEARAKWLVGHQSSFDG
jgi:hypothetical protein